jgi:hypothetical protein
MPDGTVRALLITPGGALEVVAVAPDPAGVAAVVGGRGPADVTARATWPVRGGDVVTVWTARSAPRGAVNELAGRVVDDLMPRLPGPVDRVWERVHDHPIAGPALLTGYRPGEGGQVGVMVDLSDVAVDLARASADGRRKRRTLAARAQARTQVIALVPTRRLPTA